MKVNIAQMNAMIVLATFIVASVFTQTKSIASQDASSALGRSSCFLISAERYNNIDWAMKLQPEERRGTALRNMKVSREEAQKYFIMRQGAEKQAKMKNSSNPQDYITYTQEDVANAIDLTPNPGTKGRFRCGDDEGKEILAYEEFIARVAAGVAASNSSDPQKAKDEKMWLIDFYRLRPGSSEPAVADGDTHVADKTIGPNQD